MGWNARKATTSGNGIPILSFLECRLEWIQVCKAIAFIKSLAINFIFYSKTHEKTGKLKIYSNFQISLNNRNNKNEPDFLWPLQSQWTRANIIISIISALFTCLYAHFRKSSCSSWNDLCFKVLETASTIIDISTFCWWLTRGASLQKIDCKFVDHIRRFGLHERSSSEKGGRWFIG